MKIVTRVAPSPTGNLHVGTARVALYNFLFARQQGGTFIVRVEDTDKARSTKEFEQNIVDGLVWLGLEHDAFYRQSERTDVYAKYIEKMIADGTAYLSKEEAEEGKRGEVIRFKNPNKVITFTDEVRGEISFDTTELGDFVIAKAVDEPLYHLTVVVDDHEMEVTHVIRGEDHISNTPRQILIQEAIGATRPSYTHLPLLLGTDRSKLSKRHGAVAITTYKEDGYFKEALINYLALLGWNPGTDQEVFSVDELIKVFSLDHVQKSGAIFTEEKLQWFNKMHLQDVPDEAFVSKIREYVPDLDPDIAQRLVPTLRERISVYKELQTLHEAGELDYYLHDPEYAIEALYWKKAENPIDAKKHLEHVQNTLKNADFGSPEALKDSLWSYAEEQGKGDVLWPFRYALSGADRSPDPFTLAFILGPETVNRRLRIAIEKMV